MDRISRPNYLFFYFHTLLLLSFLQLASAGSVAVTTPSCLPDQSSALLQFKEGFNDSCLTSWKPGTDCCRGWEGVSCNQSSGHVTDLDLSNYNIAAGNLSVAIFELTSLRHLNLGGICFSNDLPNGFEKLTKLTYLNLSNSCIQSQILIGIANLTNLISLDLSYIWSLTWYNPNMSLPKPSLRILIGNLNNLRELYLDGVAVSESGNGTEWCGALSESLPLLQVLSMVYCNLSGPIDASLSRLHSLSVIHLGYNNFNSPVPDFFSDFPLKDLKLYYSNLKGSFPCKIFQIPTLTIIDLSLNTDLVTLCNFPLESSLETMDLSGTNLLGHIPYSIGNLHNLSFLGLSSSSLSGQIPSFIGKLTKLAHLDMSYNLLFGSIPQTLFAHPNLEKLHLRNNKLSGQFRLEEDSSVSFSPLTDLELSSNQLTGSIPVAIYKLSNLKTLYLSGNKLSGPIPISIFWLSSLDELFLDQNYFNGTFALGLLPHLPNLTALSLSHNQLSIEDVSEEALLSQFPRISSYGLASCNLSQIPPLFRYHSGFDYVDLSKNHMHGDIPSWIWGKFNDAWQRSLNLSYNKFTSIDKISICPILPICWSFYSIDLSYNQIRGHIPLISAQQLDYSNNELSEIPSNFAPYLNQTIFLYLSANRLSGEIPTFFCEALYLTILDLSHNNFSGLIPPCIFEAPTLQMLILASNNFHGNVPNNFPKTCQIIVLDLSNNDLDGEVPKALTSCTNLMILNMENNRIVDTFPFWLAEIPYLQVLSLRSNQLYGTLEVPSKLASNISLFQSLRVVDLASNNIHGSLPLLLFENLKCMVNLSLYEITANKYVELLEYSINGYGISIIDKGIQMILETISASLMVSIDLSNNKFSGNIPEMIGNLSALTALNLSHNALTGSIPHSLKGLDLVESLDLSWNNLSGEIPQELTSLDFLSKLNLSFNHLVGKIPQSLQFSTFDNSSFEGNPGLCGVPLSKQCKAASPTKNLSFISTSSSKNRTAIVLLFLFVGLGFGTGFAIVIVYPMIKRAKTRSTTR